MEDGVNFVSLEAVHNLRWICDIAMVESEISLVVQSASVVQRSAVVQLIKRHNIVGIRVGQGKMSDEPACYETRTTYEILSVTGAFVDGIAELWDIYQ